MLPDRCAIEKSYDEYASWHVLWAPRAAWTSKSGFVRNYSVELGYFRFDLKPMIEDTVACITSLLSPKTIADASSG